MDEHLQFTQQKRLERVAKALRKNRMEAHVVATAAEVVPLVKTFLKEGETVANGGSMTLAECGVMDLLAGGAYTFLDRAAAKTPEEATAIYHQHFGADTYLASANAVTEEGEVYEMDGRANRVACLAYGPTQVVLVVGQNKVVDDIDAARMRNFTTAAPANAHRLSAKTPCAKTGECIDCDSPERLCCTELVLGPQREVGRIKVVLVGEDLGY